MLEKSLVLTSPRRRDDVGSLLRKSISSDLVVSPDWARQDTWIHDSQPFSANDLQVVVHDLPHSCATRRVEPGRCDSLDAGIDFFVGALAGEWWVAYGRELLGDKLLAGVALEDTHGHAHTAANNDLVGFSRIIVGIDQWGVGRVGRGQAYRASRGRKEVENSCCDACSIERNVKVS